MAKLIKGRKKHNKKLGDNNLTRLIKDSLKEPKENKQETNKVLQGYNVTVNLDTPTNSIKRIITLDEKVNGLSGGQLMENNYIDGLLKEMEYLKGMYGDFHMSQIIGALSFSFFRYSK